VAGAGFNLTKPNDWDPTLVFIDEMRTARRPGSTSKPFDESAPTDGNGWPIGDAGFRVLTGVPATPSVGTHKLSATGVGQVSAFGAKVQNQAYDAASNRTTADIVVGPTTRTVTLELKFTGTNGGVRDIKLLAPGYDDDKQVFRKEFLKACDDAAGFRLMDWGATNNSTMVEWADRVPPERATWRDQVPYEIQLKLGLQTGKPIWINVPVMASDEFIRQLGKLIRQTVPTTGPPVLLEYSNEVWNGQFKQFSQNLDAAVADVAAGDTSLTDGGTDPNKYYWARRRIARRGVEISKLVGHPQVRCVLTSQIGFAPPGAMLKQQLEYVEKYQGPPSQFFAAVGGAYYHSPGKLEDGKTWYTSVNGVTASGIAQRLLDRAKLVKSSDSVLAFNALAKKYGLASFMYEGGIDLQQFPNDVPAKIESQYDPRTGYAVEDYMVSWFESGGHAFFYFVTASKYDKNGYWGLTEDISDLTTPKYQGFQRAAKRASTMPAR
jgi:hypothetical protein